MTLVRTGQGVTDIRGGTGGVYFTRDKSGLHCAAKPRKIKKTSPQQRIQRNAFSKARTYSKDNRTVSYLIYLALNNIPFTFDAIVTGNPDPDCTGRYVLEGKFEGKDFYRRTDGVWCIFYKAEYNRWYISTDPIVPEWAIWYGNSTIQGKYEGGKPVWGTVWVTLQVQPPPPNYNPPKL